MRLTHVCSVATAADVPAIRVLRAALDAHHPGVELTVAALAEARRPLEAIEGVGVIGFAELASVIHDTPNLLEPSEAAALAHPLLLERVLSDGAPSALLLAPDCDVRAPLAAIESALDAGDVIVLPRVDGGLPDDGERPDARDLLTAGELDEEVVAARAGAAAERCLRWWSEQSARRETGVLRAAERALPGVVRLADAGYGVSAWNLHERPLTVAPDGTLCAAARPLCLVRFAGFRPDRPWWLSEDASRARVLDDAVLARLCRERAGALIDAGWAPPVRERAIALRRDERVRRLLVEAVDTGVDLASDATLLAWLAEPGAAGASVGVTRYTHAVWSSRVDLRRAFPDLDGAHGAEYATWLLEIGRTEVALDERLLPRAPVNGDGAA
jgi:hypothetical protein